MALTHNSSEQLLYALRQEGKRKSDLQNTLKKFTCKSIFFFVCVGGCFFVVFFFATISVLTSSLLKNFLCYVWLFKALFRQKLGVRSSQGSLGHRREKPT